MASKSSISIRKNNAIEQCRDAIRTIWGEDFDVPRRFRDPTMLGAIQLEAIAQYLTCKAELVGKADEPVPVTTIAEVKPTGKPQSKHK